MCWDVVFFLWQKYLHRGWPKPGPHLFFVGILSEPHIQRESNLIVEWAGTKNQTLNGYDRSGNTLMKYTMEHLSRGLHSVSMQKLFDEPPEIGNNQLKSMELFDEPSDIRIKRNGSFDQNRLAPTKPMS